MDKPEDLMVAAYTLLSAVNVWSAFKRKWIPFCLTKPMLMLALMGVYAVSSASVSILVVIALFFAWLGDVLLLLTNKRMGEGTRSALYQSRYSFVSGGIAFIICHICYIIAFDRLSNSYIVEAFYFPIIMVYVLIGILFWKSFIQGILVNKFIKLGTGVYVFIILMMSFSSTWLITPGKPISFFPLIGSLLFILSDYLLSIGFKTNNAFRYHPWAMISYLSGQFLIIIGLILLGA